MIIRKPKHRKILKIKTKRILAPPKRAAAIVELETLQAVCDATIPHSLELQRLVDELASVNNGLWTLENEIRDHAGVQDFGSGFVAAARDIFRQNDRRCELKQAINRLLGYASGESKEYQCYRAETRPVDQSSPS